MLGSKLPQPHRAAGRASEPSMLLDRNGQHLWSNRIGGVWLTVDRYSGWLHSRGIQSSRVSQDACILRNSDPCSATADDIMAHTRFHAPIWLCKNVRLLYRIWLSHECLLCKPCCPLQDVPLTSPVQTAHISRPTINPCSKMGGNCSGILRQLSAAVCFGPINVCPISLLVHNQPENCGGNVDRGYRHARSNKQVPTETIGYPSDFRGV
jgi:hypothetical protein